MKTGIINTSRHKTQFLHKGQQRPVDKPKNKVTNVASSTIQGSLALSGKGLAIGINNQLTVKRINFENFFGILKDNFGFFDDINVSTFWCNLVRHVNEDNWQVSFLGQDLEAIIDYTYEILSEFNDSNLVNIIYDFAQLGCKGSYYVEPLEEIIIDRLQSNPKCFDCQTLVKILWAFAKIESSNRQLIDLLKTVIEPELEYFISQKDLGIAWAFEQFGYSSFVCVLKKSQSNYEDIDDKSEDRPLPQVSKPCPISTKAITVKLIQDDISREGFFKVLLDHVVFFDPVNVAVFWHRLAKNNENNEWGISFDDERLETIKERTYRIIKAFDEQGLANIIWAFAKLGCLDKKFIEIFVKEIGNRLQKRSTTDGLSLAETTSKFPSSSPEVANLKPILQKSNQFNGQNLSNIAWAIARFGYNDKKFIDELVKFIKVQLKKGDFFNSLNISMLTWAFAGFSCLNKSFIGELKIFITEKLQKDNFFKCYELSVITTASIKLFSRDSDYVTVLMKALQRKLQESNFQESDLFDPQSFSRIVFACAKLECKDANLIGMLKKITMDLFRTEKEFIAQSLVDFTWGFAKLECKDKDFVVPLKRIILAKLKVPNFFSDKIFAKMTSSLAKLGSIDEYTIKASKALSSIVWAFAKFECLDTGFVDVLKKLISTQLEIPGFFNINELSEIAWAFAKFGCRDSKFISLLKQSTEYCLQNSTSINPHEIYEILTAFTQFGCRDYKFMDSLKALIGPQLESYESLNEVTCAFERLACSDTSLVHSFLVPDLSRQRSVHNKPENNISTSVSEPYSVNDMLANPEIKLNVFFEILKNNLASFDNDNVVVVWTSLAMHKDRNKWKVLFNDARLQPIRDYTRVVLRQFSAKHIADITLAISELECIDDNFIAILAKVIEDNIRGWGSDFFNREEFAKINLAFSNFKNFKSKLANPVIQPAVFFKILDDNFDLDNVVAFWINLAMRKKKYYWQVSFNDTRLNATRDYTYKILDKLNAENLAEISLAVSEVGSVDDNFIAALKKAIESNIRLFNGKDLASISLAFSNFKSTDTNFDNIIKKTISANLKIVESEVAVIFSKKKCDLTTIPSNREDVVDKPAVDAPHIKSPESVGLRFENSSLDEHSTSSAEIVGELVSSSKTSEEDMTSSSEVLDLWYEGLHGIPMVSKKKGSLLDLKKVNGSVTTTDRKFYDTIRKTMRFHGNIDKRIGSFSVRPAATVSYKEISKSRDVFAEESSLITGTQGSITETDLVSFWTGLAKDRGTYSPELVFNDKSFKSVRDYTRESLDKLSAECIADITLSLSKIKCVDVNFIDALKKVIENRIQEQHFFNSAQLDKISLAFSNFENTDSEFDRVIKNAIASDVKRTEKSSVKFVTLDEDALSSSEVFSTCHEDFKTMPMVSSKKDALSLKKADDTVTVKKCDFTKKDDKKPKSIKTENVSNNSFHESDIIDFWVGLARDKGKYTSKVVFNDKSFKAVRDFTHVVLDKLSAKGLADVTFSISELKCVDVTFINTLKKVIKDRVQEQNFFNSIQLSKISLAFSNLGITDVNFGSVIKNDISSDLKRAENGCAKCATLEDNSADPVDERCLNQKRKSLNFFKLCIGTASLGQQFFSNSIYANEKLNNSRLSLKYPARYAN